MLGDNNQLFTGKAFSVAAVFQTESHGQCEVRGIFDNPFFDTGIGQAALDTTSLRFTVTLDPSGTAILNKNGKPVPYNVSGGIEAEIPVRIRGVVYSIVRIEPDGTGIATILLAHEP